MPKKDIKDIDDLIYKFKSGREIKDIDIEINSKMQELKDLRQRYIDYHEPENPVAFLIKEKALKRQISEKKEEKENLINDYKELTEKLLELDSIYEYDPEGTYFRINFDRNDALKEDRSYYIEKSLPGNNSQPWMKIQTNST